MNELENELAQRRQVAYDKLTAFAANRASWYGDSKKINLKKLHTKDIIIFAARGVSISNEFVDEAFRAYESPTLAQRLASEPGHPVAAPCQFHEHLPEVLVAGLRDATPSLLIGVRILGGHDSQPRRERRRVPEP